jgi:hypothetical protein
MSFSQIDLVINKLSEFQEEKKYNQISEYENDFTGLDSLSVQRIQKLIDSNKHKLSFPPVCELPKITVG